jgi:hypothetical protein
MPSAAAARGFLAAEQALSVLAVPSGECAARVLILDPGGSSGIVYRAAVVDGGDEGIWLATGEGDGEGEVRSLAGFGQLAEAVEAFAARLADTASRIERESLTDYPDVVAAALRYRAALAHAGVAQAALGGALRGHRARLRADHAITAMASSAGVSREFLHRVLAGAEWAWPAPAGLTPAAAQPAASPSPGRPGSAWLVTGRFVIDVADDQEAQDIAASLLRRMEISASIESVTALSGRSRAVTTRLDLSGLPEIVPADGVTCLRYVTRSLRGMTWRSEPRRTAGQAVWTWRRAGRLRGSDHGLGHHAIRAVEIRASLQSEDSHAP